MNENIIKKSFKDDMDIIKKIFINKDSCNGKEIEILQVIKEYLSKLYISQLSLMLFKAEKEQFFSTLLTNNIEGQIWNNKDGNEIQENKTIIEKLAELHPELSVSVSATTRKRRKGEIDGKHYYFIDKDKFQKLVNKDEFIEYAENYGNYYGSPRRNYTEAMENNQDVVFALSVEGMQNAVKNKDMDFITIFIGAPSDDILLKRLKDRKTETNKQVAERFKKAKHEMSYAYLYDYVVYNYEFENTVKNIEAIYLAEKLKRLK